MSTADEVPRPGGLPLWEVPGWRERWGVLAGITGRGANPAEPFDLGLWTQRPVAEVMGRWRSFRRQFPQCPTALMSHQAHGDRVLWHDSTAPGWTIQDGADGHATATAGQLLLVTVADCVPIYLIAPEQRAIALLHAGWRGTALGILACGVERLISATNAKSSEIVMHAGIAICGSCYEVGSEVMTAVGLSVDGPGPWQLDLRDVLIEQAGALGLGEVTRSGHCTACQPDQFFSHRGSGGTDGRMVAYLGWPSTAGG